MIESVLLTTVRVSTLDGKRPLSAASGFFFEREGRLFLVTSRHVVVDNPSRHFPDRIEIGLHTDPKNLTSAMRLSVPLFLDGKGIWRQGNDAGGEIDVAVIELDRAALPPPVVLRCLAVHHHRRAAGAAVHPRISKEATQALEAQAESRGDHCMPHHREVVQRIMETEREADDQQRGADFHLLEGALQIHRRAIAVEAARYALRAHGHGRPRPATRRDAGAELRLVC